MPVQVLFFGPVTEIFQSSEITVDHVADTDSLVAALGEQFPALKGVKFAIAVDKQLVTGNAILPDSATVALLPPFSGG